MQFPVPQFTDVEDKIIANLSVKQFGILFAAGVVIFLFFSATKNIIGTVIVFLFVGVPALAVAFMKVNGRPLYRIIGHLLAFFIHPRQLLFHKQGYLEESVGPLVVKEDLSDNANKPNESQSRLVNLEAMLEKQRVQEQELLKQTQNKS